MKILVIPAWYPIAENITAGLFVEEQVKFLLERPGIEMAVLYADVSYKKIHKVKLSKSIEGTIPVYRAEGFAFPKINTFFLKKWATIYFKLYDEYVKDFGTPDLIHAHSFIGGYAAMKLSEKIDVPFIMTEHSGIPYMASVPKRYVKIYKNVYRRCKYIIAVSRLLTEAIRKVTPVEVTTIHNFIDQSIFFKHPNVEKDKRVFKVLGVGDFKENKRFDLLIRAIYLLNQTYSINISLSLYGGGPLFSTYEKIVESLGMSDYVTIGGVISREQVAIEMNQADVFCLPSKFESFGIVLIESLACGTPVVATGKGGPKDIVCNNNGIYTQDGTPEGIAKAIYTIYENYDDYVSDENIEDTVKMYNKDFILDQIFGVYHKVLREKN